MNEETDILIAKALNGELSEAEQQQFHDWLAADMRHRERFESVKALWEDAVPGPEDTAFDTAAAWKKVAAATGLPVHPLHSRRAFRLPAWAKISFSAAALLLAGFFLYRFLDPGGMVQVEAGAHQLSMVLPDNSHVDLRAGAVLRYPRQFETDERRVALKGEAFFEITPGPDRPFIIDAQSATVQVVGTSFNVACNENEAKVTVATGKVKMSASGRGAQKTVVLVPGEQGRLKKGTLSKDFVSSDSYLYWKTGVLNFREQSFSNVIKELGNMSQTTIFFDESMPAGLRSQLVTISFKDQDIEDMLTDLCLITHCEWSRGNDGYTILAAD